VCKKLLKIPTVWEKCQKTAGGIFFDSHCILIRDWAFSCSAYAVQFSRVYITDPVVAMQMKTRNAKPSHFGDSWSRKKPNIELLLPLLALTMMTMMTMIWICDDSLRWLPLTVADRINILRFLCKYSKYSVPLSNIYYAVALIVKLRWY